MEKICKTFRVLFVLTVAFSLTSCKETDDPAPSETTDTNKVRLKHLTTEQEITEALGAYVAGWDPGELHLTELGTRSEERRVGRELSSLTPRIAYDTSTAGLC